ncbi:MAG: SBBP repeat-containing protein [candidate division WOR-3 bacterium]
MLSVQSLAGQELVWEEATYENGSPGDVVVDPAGNVYVTGSSGSHIRTAKYASNDGEEIWAVVWTSHNGYGDAICLDDSANVYVAGPIYVDAQ